MDQDDWARQDWLRDPRFDATGITGIVVWLPRHVMDRPNVQQAMTEGRRLSELVTKATRNWLHAHQAPDAWVSVAVQQHATSPQEERLEAQSAFQSLGNHHAWRSSVVTSHLGVHIALWGAPLEGDRVEVINTIGMVVESAIIDTGVRFGETLEVI